MSIDRYNLVVEMVNVVAGGSTIQNTRMLQRP
jgi:hypothetical protein